MNVNEIFSKFDKSFVDRYYYDYLFTKVVAYLEADTDPILIIQQLLKLNYELKANLEKVNQIKTTKMSTATLTKKILEEVKDNHLTSSFKEAVCDIVDNATLDQLFTYIGVIESKGKVVFIFRDTVEIRERIDMSSPLLVRCSSSNKVATIREAVKKFSENELNSIKNFEIC